MNPKAGLETSECISSSGDGMIGRIYFLGVKGNQQKSFHLSFVTRIIKSLQKAFMLKLHIYFKNSMYSYSNSLSPKELECSLKT